MHPAKRVLRYIQGTSTLGITYRPLPLQLKGYLDANWAGDMDTIRSTTGYIITLNNCAIAWKSRRQPTVALSTMESEYMALTEVTKELMDQTLLAELDSKSKDEPTLFSDNQSAIALAENPVTHPRAKNIDLRYHFVREAIQDKIIWVKSPRLRCRPTASQRLLDVRSMKSAPLAWVCRDAGRQWEFLFIHSLKFGILESATRISQWYELTNGSVREYGSL
jgi:hypothetical protein